MRPQADGPALRIGAAKPSTGRQIPAGYARHAGEAAGSRTRRRTPRPWTRAAPAPIGWRWPDSSPSRSTARLVREFERLRTDDDVSELTFTRRPVKSVPMRSRLVYADALVI